MIDRAPASMLPWVVGFAAASATVGSMSAFCFGRSIRRRASARGHLEMTRGLPSATSDPIRLPRRLLRWLDSADLAIDGAMSAPAVGLAMVTPAALVVFAGPAAALGCVLVACVGVVMAVLARQGAADRRYESDLPDALDLLVRALRSGASLSRALMETATQTDGPLGVDLAWLGHPSPTTTLDRRLVQWPDRRPIAAVRLVAAALSLGHESGSGQSMALEGAAESLRVRLETHAELRAQSVQSRMSAAVIAAAPIGFLALTALIDQRVPRFLLDNTMGRLSLLAGLVLDIIAAATMVRLTSRSVD